jgi:hypothetical protein
MTTNELDSYPNMIIQLLTTNSPKKRIGIVNDWITKYDFPLAKMQPILHHLHNQMTFKEQQGSIGGKSKGPPSNKSADNSTEIVLLARIATLLEANQKAPAATKRSKKEAQETYLSPIWVSKCTASCTLCRGAIESCPAFRWKRDGLYESFHPTCIPNEHRVLFEAVKGYRSHFALDRVIVVEDLN